jgi:hypothetical protein
MVTVIFSSFVMLKDTLIVMIFFFTVVAIASFQVFNGKLKQRCFSPKTVNNKQMKGICNNEYSDNYLNCKQDSDCNPDEICGKIIKNPNNDALNYDTFLYSLIQVQSITVGLPDDDSGRLDRTDAGPAEHDGQVPLALLLRSRLLRLTHHHQSGTRSRHHQVRIGAGNGKNLPFKAGVDK